MRTQSFGRNFFATVVACVLVAACAGLSRATVSVRAQSQSNPASASDASTARPKLTPRLVAAIPDYDGPKASIFVALVAFSPDGRVLALSRLRNKISLYDTETGNLLCTLSTKRDWFNAFSFSPDSRTAVTRDGFNRTVRVWEVSSGRELHALKGRKSDIETVMKDPTLPADYFFAVPMSPDGKTVLAEREDDIAVMFDAATGREKGVLDHKTESNTGKTILLMVFRGQYRQLHLQPVYSPDGRRLVTVNGDAQPKLWDGATGQLVAALKEQDDRVYNAAFSPDSRLLATETAKGTVMIWDVDSGRPKVFLDAREIDYSYLNTAKAFGSPSFAFSPDSHTLVTYRARDTQLWDAETGALKARLPKSETRSAVFSPDSRTLVTCGGDNAEAKFWDAQSGQLLRALPKPEKRCHQVALSPDGRILLTASDAGVNLWDAESGELLSTLERARFPARFSPDGRMLAAGGAGKTALLYELLAH